MPARKEWHVIELTPGTQMSARRRERVEFNWDIVRYLPLPKRKTGREVS
jgi:hypothetical protein